jgi:hypothetical protein
MKCRPIIAWLGFRLNQKSNRSSQASSKKRDRRFQSSHKCINAMAESLSDF